MAVSHCGLSNFRHLTESGTAVSSKCSPGARQLAMTFRATRDGHTCRRRSNLALCKARVTAGCIYRYQYICRYTEAMADASKNLSALFGVTEKIRSVAPLCPASDAAFAAGHHGCSLACQAPIYLSGELEAQTLARYCLNCRIDHSLSHHAVQRVLPDQPGLRPAPAILRRGIMRPFMPWPRHHPAHDRPRCASSPPRQCAPSCWPAPLSPASRGGAAGYP